jgi:dihydroxy-acid dehydratase
VTSSPSKHSRTPSLSVRLLKSIYIVLHLLAIANEAEVPLTLADFNRIGDRVPHPADVKAPGKIPSG